MLLTMGMAASQARLLSITTRLSDNELRSQLINNSKMRLATESSQVSEAYIDALNNTTYMFTNYDADNKATYQNLTFNSLTAYNEFNNQYGLSNAAGQILVSEKDATYFEGSGGDLAKFLKYYGLEYKTTYFDRLAENYSNAGGYVFLDEGTSLFTTDQLKIMYEGGTDSTGTEWAGYDASLMSKEFNDYITYLNTYETAKKNYDNGIQEAMEDTLSSNATYADILNFVNNYDPDDPSTWGGAEDYFNEFLNLINVGGEFSDYFYNDTTQNNTVNGGSSTFQNYLITLMDEFNTSAQTGTIEYTFDAGAVSSSGNTTTIEIDDYLFEITYDATNGYTVAVTNMTDSGDVQLTDNSDFKVDTTDSYSDPATNVGTYCNLKITVDGVTYTFNFLNDQLNNEKSYTATFSDINKAYADELCDIVTYFESKYKYEFDPSKFADSANNPYIDEYELASQELSKLIFGTDVGFNNYQYLDDYRWVVENNEYTYVDGYKSILTVLALEEVLNIYGDPLYAYIKDGDEDANGDAEAQWYTNLFYRMQEGYQVLEKGLASSEEWIKYALESGLVKLEQVDSTNTWNSLIYTSCSDITETTDSLAVTKAEAEYNKAMNKIEAKDKIYDLELKNIDTEHTALETEYDSIKSALDKNVERVFKLYS